MIAACVPVKQLEAGKSRLVQGLGRESIERLTLAMLEDVVGALARARDIDAVAVVTPDDTVARAAAALGAKAILRPDPGLNPSLDAATAELDRDGSLDALLIVLGDVAGVRAEDVTAMFEALAGLGGSGVVLAPSRDGGTSALLRRPPELIRNRFGKESAAAHREMALRAGVAYSELPLPSLAIDLDRPEDLRDFLAQPGSGPRTRTLLLELGVEPTPRAER